jgi:hypothetical protein
VQKRTESTQKGRTTNPLDSTAARALELLSPQVEEVDPGGKVFVGQQERGRLHGLAERSPGELQERPLPRLEERRWREKRDGERDENLD